MSYRAAWFFLPLMLFTLLLSPYASRGELRPLNLPSTQQPQVVSAPSVNPAPARPSVYDKFRQEVVGLDEGQKQEYRDSFERSIVGAEAEGNWAAVAYYQELLSILNASSPGTN